MKLWCLRESNLTSIPNGKALSHARAVPYVPSKAPLYGEEPLGKYQIARVSVADSEDCLELTSEDLADNNDYQGWSLRCS